MYEGDVTCRYLAALNLTSGDLRILQRTLPPSKNPIQVLHTNFNLFGRDVTLQASGFNAGCLYKD